MEILGNSSCVCDRDTVGQHGVGARHPGFDLASRLGGEVYDLICRMDARIRSPRAGDTNGLVGNR